MELIKKISVKAVFVLVPLAAASALYDWKMLPVSILIGGLLGFVNLKGLAWGVQGLLGSQKATGRMIIFSMLRLIMLFLILSLLVYLRLVNIFGILIGLTVVFVLLIIEGLSFAKKETGEKSP